MKNWWEFWKKNPKKKKKSKQYPTVTAKELGELLLEFTDPNTNKKIVNYTSGSWFVQVHITPTTDNNCAVEFRY
jgi:hypothetical protein